MRIENNNNVKKARQMIIKYAKDPNVCGARCIIMAAIVLGLLIPFTNISSLKRFGKNSRFGYFIASWYELCLAITEMIFQEKISFMTFYENPHNHLSIMMGAMFSYKGHSLILNSCYIFLYLRSIAMLLSRYVLPKTKLDRESYKFITDFAENDKHTLHIAYLEVVALFEFILWKIVLPSSAKRTLLMYEYLILIISFGYIKDPSHQNIWKAIHQKVKRFARKYGEDYVKLVDDIASRFSDICKIIATLQTKVKAE